MQQDDSDNPDQPTNQGHGSQPNDANTSPQLPRTQSYDLQALLQQAHPLVDTDLGSQFGLFDGPQNQPGSPAAAAAYEALVNPVTAGIPPVAPVLQPGGTQHDFPSWSAAEVQFVPAGAIQLQPHGQLYPVGPQAAAAAAMLHGYQQHQALQQQLAFEAQDQQHVLQQLVRSRQTAAASLALQGHALAAPVPAPAAAGAAETAERREAGAEITAHALAAYLFASQQQQQQQQQLAHNTDAAAAAAEAGHGLLQFDQTPQQLGAPPTGLGLLQWHTATTLMGVQGHVPSDLEPSWQQHQQQQLQPAASPADAGMHGAPVANPHAAPSRDVRADQGRHQRQKQQQRKQQQASAAAAVAAETAAQQQQAADPGLMTYERYSELVKKDDRPCPARLNNRGTLGRDYTGQAAFTDNSGESSSRDGSAKKKRKVNNRPNMIAAGRAATGQASKAAGVAAGSSQQRNRQPAGDMGRQNSLLAIGRNVKALLGRRGQELWNTLCTLYANKSGGLNQAGVKAFLHLVLGPEKVDGQYSWRWPATAEQGHAGIVRFLGRWLSILTGTFIHPAEVNDCYLSERPSEETPVGQSKRRKRSSKTIASEQWLREHRLAPWTWSFPSPIGPVDDGADPPPPLETLSQDDIYAIEDAALKAVRERGQAQHAARLEAALRMLRARPQAVIEKELDKVVKTRHALQQAVISKAVVAAADEVLQQQPAAAAEPGNNQDDSAAVAAAATPPLQQTAEQTALEPPAAAAVDAQQDIQEGQQQLSAAGDAGDQSTHADQVQPSAEAVHVAAAGAAAAAAATAQPTVEAAAQDAAAAAPTRRSSRPIRRNTQYGDDYEMHPRIPLVVGR